MSPIGALGSGRHAGLMRVVCLALLVAVLVVSVPSPAYGFNLFRELRNGVRGAGRVAGHVLAVPGKAVQFVTRPLPRQVRRPVRILGTIALTRNLIRNPKIADLFRRARATQQVASDVGLISDAKNRLRDAYNEEAANFTARAKAIDDQIAEIKASPQAGDISRMVSLRQLQENYNQAATLAANRANRVSDGDVIELLAQKSLVPRVLGGVKSVAKKKLDEALTSYVTPSTIERFIRGGITPEAMVELIITGDARTIVSGRGLPDDFVDELRDALKQQLRNDVDFFKKNWRAELDRIIVDLEQKRGQQVAEGEGEGEGQGEGEGETAEGSDEDAPWDSEPEGYEGETEGYDTDEDSGDQAGADADTSGEGQQTWVVWYGTDMGFQPIRIWEKEAFEADTPGNSIEGGGIGTEPIAKTSVGEYPTLEAAQQALAGQLSNVRTMSGIYAGMLVADFQGETHNIENIGFDPRDGP